MEKLIFISRYIRDVPPEHLKLCALHHKGRCGKSIGIAKNGSVNRKNDTDMIKYKKIHADVFCNLCWTREGKGGKLEAIEKISKDMRKKIFAVLKREGLYIP